MSMFPQTPAPNSYHGLSFPKYQHQTLICKPSISQSTIMSVTTRVNILAFFYLNFSSKLCCSFDISNVLHVLAINVNIYPHLHYCLKVWGQIYFNETSHAHQGCIYWIKIQ